MVTRILLASLVSVLTVATVDATTSAPSNSPIQTDNGSAPAATPATIRKQAAELRRRNEHNKAVALLVAGIKATQGDHDLIVDLVDTFNESGQYEKAIKLCNAMIADNEKDGAAWGGLGYALFETKEPQKAALALRRAIEINDKDDVAACNLAWLYNDAGQYMDAIKVCSAFLSKDERCNGLWRELGFAYLKTDEHKKAVKALTKALELDPRDKPSYEYLADAHKAAGRDDLAAEALAKRDEMMKKK